MFASTWFDTFRHLTNHVERKMPEHGYWMGLSSNSQSDNIERDKGFSNDQLQSRDEVLASFPISGVCIGCQIS